jgi:hypothetical protein
MEALALGDRPVLTLADLEAYDPTAPAGRRERRFCCPCCGDGHRHDAAHRSLVLQADSGLWVCHRCGARGQLREHWRPLPPRRAALARTRAAAVVRFETRPEAATDPLPVLQAALPLAGTPGADYVEARGIPVAVAVAAGVRYHASLYGREALVFPLWDKARRVVAVNCRFLDTDEQHHKTVSFGARGAGVFRTRGALAGDLVVCEGPMDALSLASIGIPAVALVGTSGPEWLPVTCGLRHVALALDADEAGDAGAEKLGASLRSLGATVSRWRLTGGKDANDVLQRFGPDGLRQAVGRAIAHARPDTWTDSEADVCHECGAPAVGYAPDARKACPAHLNGGSVW